MSGGALTGFLEASVRTTTPLAFAALGELVVERSGVINIGLEGAIIAGAFGSYLVVDAGGIEGGFAAAAAAGIMIAAIFAFFVVTLRSDQIIVGTAISMLGLGLTGTLYSTLNGAGSSVLRTAPMFPLPVPVLRNIPIIGPAFFNQPAVTYALYGLVPAMAWWMYRSSAGLGLRAVGENPEAARAVGISPSRVRWFAILFGGLLGGISGAALVLAQVGTFAEGMSSGRGFIAIAAVVLGRWTPWGVVGAAFLFGSASAVQYLFQSLDWNLPYQLALAFPYVLTLVALASVRGRAAAPAALGLP